MSFLKMDPNLELSEVPIFKRTGIVFIIGAIIMAVVIACNSDLKLDPSFTGFNFAFFTVFKVPLAFAATGIAIIGLIAAIHRSAQTSLQIAKSSEQNTFSNFYKHRQEYIDQFKEIENDKKSHLPSHITSHITDKRIKEYYRLSYPNNSPLLFSNKSYTQWLTLFENTLIQLTSLLMEVHKSNNENVLFLLYYNFLQQEIYFKKTILGINELEKCILENNDKDKKIRLNFPNNPSRGLSINGQILMDSFKRLNQYSSLIETLKTFANSEAPCRFHKSSSYVYLTGHSANEFSRVNDPILKFIYSDKAYINININDSINVKEAIESARNITDNQS